MSSKNGHFNNTELQSLKTRNKLMFLLHDSNRKGSVAEQQLQEEHQVSVVQTRFTRT